jgi:alkaline phosphatase D
MLSVLPSLAAVVLAAAVARPAATVQAGPVLGYTSLREAAVWVQTTRPARVELRYRPLGEAVALGARVPWPAGHDPSPLPAARPAVPGSRTMTTSDDEEDAATFVLDGLEPNTRYAYELRVDGAPVAKPSPLTFSTQPLWQWRHEPPDFLALFGSCLYINDPVYDRPGTPYGGEHQILRAMAAQKPDLMIWLGDNTYTREVDYGTAAGLRYRYRRDRAFAELAPLLAAAPQYAIWDDHDYGPDNSDGSYLLKDESLRLFRLYWPAVRYGLPDVPGVFQTFSWSDVDFFLLDDRYHRKPDHWPAGPDRRMLGAAQMEWLKQALVASNATFKVVALGNQVLNPTSTGEALTLYPVEYEELIGFLRAAKVEGVLFISGDVHRSELMRVVPEGLYPLYDFTSSPLTSSVSFIKPDHPQWDNPARVPGTLLQERSFGTLRVEGRAGARRITLAAHGVSGEEKWSRTIERAELGWPVPKKAGAPADGERAGRPSR